MKACLTLDAIAASAGLAAMVSGRHKGSGAAACKPRADATHDNATRLGLEHANMYKETF
jgi:hypothetical protein